VSPELLALGLTLVAGATTGIGGLIAFVVRRPGDRFMAASLGASAGVMLLVSFVELYPRAAAAVGFVPASVAFFVGVLLLFALDAGVPHRFMAEEESTDRARLLRTGTLTALGVGIHNFPEGLAVFASALDSAQLGVAMTVAIAVHNVPEGIAVAAPVLAATGSRWRAFGLSALTGLAEPAGAFVALLLLGPLLTPTVLNYALAFVAGIMVFVSLDELLPAAHRYRHEHVVISGLIGGMAVMAASLALLVP
jgi:ZIP family zinc transporter